MSSAFISTNSFLLWEPAMSRPPVAITQKPNLETDHPGNWIARKTPTLHWKTATLPFAPKPHIAKTLELSVRNYKESKRVPSFALVPIPSLTHLPGWCHRSRTRVQIQNNGGVREKMRAQSSEWDPVAPVPTAKRWTNQNGKKVKPSFLEKNRVNWTRNFGKI